MIVLGTDAHKRSHTSAAVGAATGEHGNRLGKPRKRLLCGIRLDPITVDYRGFGVVWSPNGPPPLSRQG
jgi:hypothetical protein